MKKSKLREFLHDVAVMILSFMCIPLVLLILILLYEIHIVGGV